jgi:uncharacterized protein (TIRG00374 family)
VTVVGTNARRWRRGRQLGGRALLLVFSLVSLYVLLPSLLEIFTSWRELFDLAPEWIVFALAVEALSFAAIWKLLRIALQTRSWLPVSLSQLAGNALGRVIPGGGAAALALQHRMLIRSGLQGSRVVSALTGVSVFLFSTVLALPLLSLPAILAGTPVERGLKEAAFLGGAVFVLMLTAGITVFVWNRPLVLGGNLLAAAVNRTVRRRRPVGDLPERLLSERDSLRGAFGRHWRTAVVASAGRWIFDYLALIACLRAVGAEPSPSLVLLAYVTASLLAMIPLTPGGLGFVEAGLTGMLTLSGVDATEAAVATLAYRLISFWLPIPVGGASYVVFMRRYPERRERNHLNVRRGVRDPERE